MLQLREFTESDLALAEAWLHKAHVRKWYEIPQLGVTLEDWMMECKERNGKYQWITHLIVMWQEKPIGLCQYYKATDSEEDFGTLPRIGTYGIDYLIGEEDCIGKGLGKDMLKLLVNRIFSFPDAIELLLTSIGRITLLKKHCYPAALPYRIRSRAGTYC